ncbi:Histone H2A.Z [Trichinella pseudospiralis]|uniref:Histone H2A n=1 Tax=Trichinella pseudospiralis TaxID=6337 RepID=A0A0V1ICS2_TRIPS|nr:Histone H2A.Z [Trichinella pseudospiralis]KRZ20630.1 Histone H2A.Z [Trichinella pseudospiralis]KRZ40030.1 Histone H2A.Z [Trichinella pseudospiralis]
MEYYSWHPVVNNNQCGFCQRKIDETFDFESFTDEYGKSCSENFFSQFQERVRAENELERAAEVCKQQQTNQFQNPDTEIQSNEQNESFIIPVGVIKKAFQEKFPNSSVSIGAAIYFTAVLEYLLAELVDVSGTVAKKLKCRRIDPSVIAASLLNDSELRSLFESKSLEESLAEKSVFLVHGEIEVDAASTSSSPPKATRKCLLLVYD